MERGKPIFLIYPGGIFLEEISLQETAGTGELYGPLPRLSILFAVDYISLLLCPGRKKVRGANINNSENQIGN